MTECPAPGHAAREALTRRAGVAVTLCLFAWLALLPPHVGVAQDRSRSPTPEKLWKEYPLAPTAAPSVEPTVASTPAPHARDERRPGTDDDGAPGVAFVLLALVMAGGSITLLRLRGRREREPQVAAAPHAPSPVPAVPVIPAMWFGRSGRFTRPTTRTTGSRATATVASASAPAPGRGGSRAGGGAPVPRVAADPPAGDPSPVTPASAEAPAGSPPDRRLGWTAEIEWRQTDGRSRFCVIARGAGTVVIAQSPSQAWPPIEPAAVHAMTDAAERLATMLADAGWKALPPGPAWYAKRFAWEPVVDERVEAAPPKSTVATDAKPVASSSPATPLPPTDGGGAPDRLGSNRSRWPRIALLCVLLALGPIAALTLNAGQDDAPPVRPAPAPVTKDPAIPTAQPKPKPTPSHGIDVTVPVIVLLGLFGLVLVIRQTRRVRR